MGWLKKATGGKLQTPKSGKDLAKANIDFMTLGLGVGDKVLGNKKQPGEDGYEAQQAALIAQQQAAYGDFVNGGAPTYEQGDDFEYQELGELEKLGSSAYGDISTDPKYKNAELDALRSLEERSKEGLTKQDEADMLKLRQDVDRRNRGRTGLIQQQMQQRGISGSGLDLVAQMQAGQDATEMEALASIEKAAQSQNNKRAAANDLGNMSSQMQSKDFQQQAQKAAAADTIARYNNQNTNNRAIQNNQGQNNAAMQNWNRGNATSDKNAASQYDFRKDKLGAQNAATQSQFNYNADNANRAALKKQQDAAAKAGQFGALGSIAGAGAGAFFGAGNPAAITAGSQVGGQFGQAYGNYSHGGTIPGPEISPFDDPANDVVPIFASGGEVVLPKSVARSPAAAADFVAKENAKAIDPEILDQLAKTDPDLVAKYRQKMSGADQGVKAAQKMQDYGSIANVGGKILNDFSNSQKKDLVFHNRMQELGSVPKVQKADRPEYDGSAIDKLGQQGVDRATQYKKDQEGQFFSEEKLSDLSQSRADQTKTRDNLARKEDPNSQESQQMRDFIKANYPGLVSANFDKASASFLESKLPMLAQKYQADENRKMRSEDRQATRENTNAIREAASGVRQKAAEAKHTEKMEQLRVGDLGYAQTPDDAKKLKDSVESKANFDNKLNQLIKLREENGGEMLNREAVSRGQQLSKDLLLEYKNLQKLGVLSVSDEEIINKIIPSDPLEYRSPLAALQGQDPILSNMKAFQADAEKDYQTKLNNRLRREGRSEKVGNSDKTTTLKIMHGSDLPD